MRKTITWGRSTVTMEVCRSCGVGAGVTLYPDGPFVHQQARLRSDLCDDCLALVLRKGLLPSAQVDGAGNGAGEGDAPRRMPEWRSPLLSSGPGRPGGEGRRVSPEALEPVLPGRSSRRGR
jgi:hypothetical protein